MESLPSTIHSSSDNMSTNATIATDGVVKRYGETFALDNVSLEIPAGSIYGLVGPNGSGKTTLLHLLAGLVRPSAGSVQVFGEPVAGNEDEVLSRIGVVHEDFGVYEELTGREHLRYLGSGSSNGVDPADALEIVNLGHAADDPVGTYSGGMIKRLGLAIALAGEPDILLLDEPFAALDMTSTETVLETLRDRHSEGTTIVFSTHMFEFVERICTHAALLGNGGVLAAGAIDDICGDAARVTVCGDVADCSWMESLQKQNGITEVSLSTDGTATIQGTLVACFQAAQGIDAPPEAVHLSYPSLANVATDREGAGP